MGQKRGKYDKTGGRWPNNLGVLLRLWRKHNNLTQSEAAREISIGWGMLAAIETGHRPPGIRTILKVMDWFIRKPKRGLVQ